MQLEGGNMRHWFTLVILGLAFGACSLMIVPPAVMHVDVGKESSDILYIYTTCGPGEVLINYSSPEVAEVYVQKQIPISTQTSYPLALVVRGLEPGEGTVTFSAVANGENGQAQATATMKVIVGGTSTTGGISLIVSEGTCEEVERGDFTILEAAVKNESAVTQILEISVSSEELFVYPEKQTVKVQPGKVFEFSFTVKVPESAEPGMYLVTIKVKKEGESVPTETRNVCIYVPPKSKIVIEPQPRILEVSSTGRYEVMLKIKNEGDKTEDVFLSASYSGLYFERERLELRPGETETVRAILYLDEPKDRVITIVAHASEEFSTPLIVKFTKKALLDILVPEEIELSGGPNTLKFRVQNDTPDDKEVWITFKNLPDTVEVHTNPEIVRAGASKEIEVYMIVRKGFGRRAIEVCLNTDEGETCKTTMLTYTGPTEEELELEVTGSGNVYEFKVRNVSIRSLENLKLLVTPPEGWTYTVSPEKASLLPGEEATFRVVFKAADGAEKGYARVAVYEGELLLKEVQIELIPGPGKSMIGMILGAVIIVAAIIVAIAILKAKPSTPEKPEEEEKKPESPQPPSGSEEPKVIVLRRSKKKT